MIDFYTPLSSFHANGAIATAAASNIANINTDGYKVMNVHLQSGPDDRGVQVAAVYRDMSPGPAIINNLTENDVRNYQDTAALGMRNSQENYDTAQAQDVTRTQQAESAEAIKAQNIRSGENALSQFKTGYIEGSNTDLPREFVNLTLSQHAYSANAAVIRTMDEMTGSILNVKI